MDNWLYLIQQNYLTHNIAVQENTYSHLSHIQTKGWGVNQVICMVANGNLWPRPLPLESAFTHLLSPNKFIIHQRLRWLWTHLAKLLHVHMELSSLKGLDAKFHQTNALFHQASPLVTLPLDPLDMGWPPSWSVVAGKPRHIGQRPPEELTSLVGWQQQTMGVNQGPPPAAKNDSMFFVSQSKHKQGWKPENPVWSTVYIGSNMIFPLDMAEYVCRLLTRLRQLPCAPHHASLVKTCIWYRAPSRRLKSNQLRPPQGTLKAEMFLQKLGWKT